MTRGAFRLEIDQKKLVVEPGDSQELEVRALDYSGQPVTTEVRVRVQAERVGKDGMPETVEVLDQSFRTEKDGVARIELEPGQSGYYRVLAEAKDDRGQAITAEGFLFAAEGGAGIPYGPTDLELVTDRRSYFAGDTATVLILAPSPTAHVLFGVEGGDLYRIEVLETHAARGDRPGEDRREADAQLLRLRDLCAGRQALLAPALGDRAAAREAALDRGRARSSEGAARREGILHRARRRLGGQAGRRAPR